MEDNLEGQGGSEKIENEQNDTPEEAPSLSAQNSELMEKQPKNLKSDGEEVLFNTIDSNLQSLLNQLKENEAIFKEEVKGKRKVEETIHLIGKKIKLLPDSSYNLLKKYLPQLKEYSKSPIDEDPSFDSTGLVSLLDLVNESNHASSNRTRLIKPQGGTDKNHMDFIHQIWIENGRVWKDPNYDDPNEDVTVDWLNKQSNKKRLGTIEPKVLQFLQKVGFHFKKITWNASWEDRLEMILKCKLPDGKFLVRGRPRFTRWANLMRRNARLGHMSSEKIILLKSIGFLEEYPDEENNEDEAEADSNLTLSSPVRAKMSRSPKETPEIRTREKKEERKIEVKKEEKKEEKKAVEVEENKTEPEKIRKKSRFERPVNELRSNEESSQYRKLSRRMGDSDARVWLWFLNSVIRYQALRNYFQERMLLSYEDFCRGLKSNAKIPQWHTENTYKKLYFWYSSTLPNSLPFKFVVHDERGTMKLKQPDVEWQTKMWAILLPIHFEPSKGDLNLCRFCILPNGRKAVMAGPLALINHDYTGPFVYDAISSTPPSVQLGNHFKGVTTFAYLCIDKSVRKIGMSIEAPPPSWVVQNSSFEDQELPNDDGASVTESLESKAEPFEVTEEPKVEEKSGAGMGQWRSPNNGRFTAKSGTSVKVERAAKPQI